MIWCPIPRFGLTLLLLLAAGFFVLSSPPAAARSLGDVDNDGIFTVVDSTRQIAAVNGRVALTEADRINADLNADGAVND